MQIGQISRKKYENAFELKKNYRTKKTWKNKLIAWKERKNQPKQIQKLMYITMFVE